MYGYRGPSPPAPIDIAAEFARPQPWWPAVLAFVAAFGAAVPFMNTSLVVGPMATALHGADLGGGRAWRRRRPGA